MGAGGVESSMVDKEHSREETIRPRSGHRRTASKDHATRLQGQSQKQKDPKKPTISAATPRMHAPLYYCYSPNTSSATCTLSPSRSCTENTGTSVQTPPSDGTTDETAHAECQPKKRPLEKENEKARAKKKNRSRVLDLRLAGSRWARW